MKRTKVQLHNPKQHAGMFKYLFICYAKLAILIGIVLSGPALSLADPETSPCPGCGRSPVPLAAEPFTAEIDPRATCSIEYGPRKSRPAIRLQSPPVRPVVLELFTAAWCPYCYGAGVALDRLEAQEYRPEELVVLAHHIVNDGFGCSASNLRKITYGVDSVPTIFLNGQNKLQGFSTSSQGEAGLIASMDKIRNAITAERARLSTAPAPFTIDIRGELSRVDPAFDVEITLSADHAAITNAMVFVIEDGVPVNASNGQTVLNRVVRAGLVNQRLDLKQPGTATLHIAYQGSINCRNAERLKPVVIIHQVSPREVLAGVSGFTVEVNATGAAWRRYE